jgi:hypothetical protein
MGQAIEDDETFWNHSTWAEGADTYGGNNLSDDGSFHESDEEEENQVDTFDSDFNDSEGEEDEQNEENEKEASLMQEEKRKKSESKSKRGYQEPGHSKKGSELVGAKGRDLINKRKTIAQKKRALRGDGMNAGLILNAPGTVPIQRVKCITDAKVLVAKKSVEQKQKVVTTKLLEPRRSTRARQSKFTVADVMRRSLRTSTVVNSVQQSEKESAVKMNAKRAKKQKNKYSQEELLLEAVQETEGENERWLLNRKRLQEDEQNRSELKSKMHSLESGAKKKTIYKYNSKRGCFNTFTFPEMDHIPDLFTQPKWSERERELDLKRLREENTCVITGKIARYRDPKTSKGYYDVQAFKELRRRYDSGMCLETPHKTNTMQILSNPSPVSLSNIGVQNHSNNHIGSTTDSEGLLRKTPSPEKRSMTQMGSCVTVVDMQEKDTKDNVSRNNLKSKPHLNEKIVSVTSKGLSTLEFPACKAIGSDSNTTQSFSEGKIKSEISNNRSNDEEATGGVEALEETNTRTCTDDT